MLRRTYYLGKRAQLIVAGIIEDRLRDADRGNHDGSAAAVTAESKTMIDVANYSEPEVLRDGTAMLIRAIRPDDKQRLLKHFNGLSAQSIYYRFFGIKRSLTEDDLAHLTELDFVNHVGLAVTVQVGDDERFIGVGRYIRIQDPHCAEVAFAVLDDEYGHGIGTLLLKHLARIAQRNGISEFGADVLARNHQMLEVFANSGFSSHNIVNSQQTVLQDAQRHEQQIKAERARRQSDIEQASLREIGLNRAQTAIRLLIDQVISFGREIWRSGDDILVFPPFATVDLAQNQLRVKLSEFKYQLLPLLPSERQGPQRI
jgi:GNAT superfamily N-acetyltransferase